MLFFQSPAWLPYYDKLVKPNRDIDTEDRNFTRLKNLGLEDPYFAFIATYEVQRSTYSGACSLGHTKQDVMYNDGSLALKKESPLTPLFSY